MFEIVADRSKGGEVHRQWYQQEGTFVIVNVLFHALPIDEIWADRRSNGKGDWYRVDNRYLGAMLREPPELESLDYEYQENA